VDGENAERLQDDREGNYVASTRIRCPSPKACPLECFISGRKARWLGVRVNNTEEQDRGLVLLMSVRMP